MVCGGENVEMSGLVVIDRCADLLLYEFKKKSMLRHNGTLENGTITKRCVSKRYYTTVRYKTGTALQNGMWFTTVYTVN